MKLTHKSVFSYLRIAIAGTFVSGALAMAFLAVNTTSVSPVNQTHRLFKKQIVNGVASRGEGSDKVATAEDLGETADDPNAAAEEAYMARAYPADDIPFDATLNAINGFNQLKSKAPKNTVGAWTLIGASTANFPSILTFSGQAYTTSGRITALAISPTCNPGNCRLWIGAAGGGVWRGDNALSGSGPSWTFVSGSFATNAIGTLVVDPTDPSGNTIYAGTGEPNASGDSEAGMGLYKSTNGGNSWTLLAATVGPITTFAPGTGTNGTYTGNAFLGRSISSIAIDPTNPMHLYVSSSRGVRGVSSTTGGATTNPPIPRPPFGLFESTNGGATFSFIWDGGDTCPVTCDGTNPKATIRGVNKVQLDPSWNGTTNTTLYGGAFGPNFATPSTASGGVWRSTDGGSTWTQIKASLVPDVFPIFENTDRAEFAVTKLPNGDTRMYVGEGSTGPPGLANGFDPVAMPAQFYRSDLVQTGTPVFTNLTAAEVPAGQSDNYCTAQCWYDNFVVTPNGNPDKVYLGGSFSYGTYGFSTNGRGVLYSTNAGMSWTDMTWDATTNATPAGSCCQPNPISPNGMHPDQHAFAVSPSNAGLFFDGSDGGLVRSSGSFNNISSQCTSPRGLTGSGLALCSQLLSAVPSHLFSLNKGLSTLQHQSVSVAADNSKHLQGGTQDNGTFDTTGSAVVWNQIIYGDGGQSGFNAGNSSLRFNTFTGQANDVNFQNGDPSKWVIASGPILSSVEAAAFYPPVIADPNSAAAGSIFQHSRHVWRTQDWAGSQAFLEANCPEFTTSAATFACGDFVPLGGPSAADCQPTSVNPCLNTGGDLGGTVYGTDRRPTSASRVGSAIARTPSNTNTAWAATAGGRVFISDNIDNATASSVLWNRVDANLSTSNDPTRFPSSIYIDPTNAHHGWVSYSGYNFNTPTHPGHVFDVSWTGSGAATWTNISYNLPDFPISSVVHDDVTGDLYAGSDFTVMRLPFGTTTWVVAGTGLPMVEVSGLTIVPGSRVLYGATHGRSVWKLNLP